MDNPFVKIEIKAVNETKAGIDSAINTTVAATEKLSTSAKKGAEDVAKSATQTAQQLGVAGQKAETLASNLTTAFGVPSEKAEVLNKAVRESVNALESAAAAANVATVSNTATAASNTAVAASAGVASTAMGILTAIFAANPIGATIVAIEVAVVAASAAWELFGAKSADAVEAANKKLKEQKKILDDIISSINERVVPVKAVAELEDKMAQKAAMRKIDQIKSVELAEKEAKLAKDRLAAAEKEEHRITIRLRDYAEALKVLQEQAKTEGESAHNTREQQSLELGIVDYLYKQRDARKQLANLSAQAEAAQDKALELPAKVAKAEAAAAKEKLKAEEYYADAIADMHDRRIKDTEKEKKAAEKLAKDKLEAEELYSDAIERMGTERRKEDEKAEKDAAKEKAKADRDAKKGEKEKDKNDKDAAPRIVGLEDLGKSIQVAALKGNKDREEMAALVAESRKAAARDAEKIALAAKSLEYFETIADDTATTAEKIEKVGTLV